MVKRPKGVLAAEHEVHARPEPVEDARKLHADVAAPDHHDVLLDDVLQHEGFVRGDDVIRARDVNLDGVAARGDEGVLGP